MVQGKGNWLLMQLNYIHYNTGVGHFGDCTKREKKNQIIKERYIMIP